MENSIEEAVKTMERWVEYEKNNKDKINKADELIYIQETILLDYKRVLEINEVLLKENKELKNKIMEKELDKEKLKYDNDLRIYTLRNTFDFQKEVLQELLESEE